MKTSIKEEIEKEYESKIDKIKLDWMEKNQLLKSQIETLQLDKIQRKSDNDQNNKINATVKITPEAQNDKLEDKLKSL